MELEFVSLLRISPGVQAPGRGVRRQPGACAKARTARHAGKLTGGLRSFPEGSTPVLS